MTPADLPDWVAAKIEVDPSGCWIWLGRLDGRKRYGLAYVNSSTVMAHRLIYHALVDSRFPLRLGGAHAGLQLDHLCRVTRCVNPSHLEPVTPRENVLRGISPPALRAAQTHCIYGHEFTPANTKWRRDGRRNCRACAREWARRHRAVMAVALRYSIGAL